MANFKPGDVVYVKITREPVFVLNVKPYQSNEVASAKAASVGLSGEFAEVRRGVFIAESTLTYRDDTFLVEELATEDELTSQEFARLTGKRRLVEQEITPEVETELARIAFDSKTDA